MSGPPVNPNYYPNYSSAGYPQQQQVEFYFGIEYHGKANRKAYKFVSLYQSIKVDKCFKHAN